MSNQVIVNVPSGGDSSGYFSEVSRTIWLNSVNEIEVKRVIDRMLFLDNADCGKPILLIVSSYGGDLLSAIELIQTMQVLMRSPVATLAMGKAYSAGSFIASAGRKGLRFCLPGSSYMVHSLSSGTEGTIHDLYDSTENMLKLQDLMEQMYRSQTGLKISVIKKMMSHDTYMDSDEAKANGLVDTVIRNPADIWGVISRICDLVDEAKEKAEVETKVKKKIIRRKK